MSTTKVAITPDHCLPIPHDLIHVPWLRPSQQVLVRAEGERLVVEQLPREEVVANLERLCGELRTGEAPGGAWDEIEAGRDDAR